MWDPLCDFRLNDKMFTIGGKNQMQVISIGCCFINISPATIRNCWSIYYNKIILVEKQFTSTYKFLCSFDNSKNNKSDFHTVYLNQNKDGRENCLIFKSQLLVGYV